MTLFSLGRHRMPSFGLRKLCFSLNRDFSLFDEKRASFGYIPHRNHWDKCCVHFLLSNVTRSFPIIRGVLMAPDPLFCYEDPNRPSKKKSRDQEFTASSSLIQGRRHRLQYKKKVDPDLVVDIKPSLRFVEHRAFIKHHRMYGILRFH